jgi:hypothetical protein
MQTLSSEAEGEGEIDLGLPFAERIRVAVDCFPRRPKMSNRQREIYHSENGDRWLLCRDDDGRAFVLHKANVSSGGTATKIEIGDFLGRGKAGPEHQALARLIGRLVDND